VAGSPRSSDQRASTPPNKLLKVTGKSFSRAGGRDRHTGGVALAHAPGRIGTGNGRLGAIVSLVLGVTGLVLGPPRLGRERNAVAASGRC
jgi:hypothetical protein